ncbi:hypothetical protein Lfu02_79070 [Longispora fulva]|nr:hypothetical protein Lfu02_79070 [Longispora fulva]
MSYVLGGLVATRDLFSAEELERLRGFAEVDRSELIRYFTLTPADEAFVRKFRGRDNVIGAAVQLCVLPWLGFVPDEVRTAPAAAAAWLSERLGVTVDELLPCGQRPQTRTDHLREIVAYLGWRQADGTYRRRIGRQLNKGENVHSLKRTLAYASEGAIRKRQHEQQAEQMWCLTLATNAIVTWMTEYHGLAVTALRTAGRHIDAEILAHIWPTHHENVHFYGTHTIDLAGELAQLDHDGYRPLRQVAREGDRS